MTLGVDAYRVDEDGRYINLPLTSNIAGAQSSLYWSYGGDKAVAAGLVLFPHAGRGGRHRGARN